MAAVMTADMDNTEKVVGWWMMLAHGAENPAAGYHPGFTISTQRRRRNCLRHRRDQRRGEGPIEAIIEARNNGGYFRELFDLCARTDTKN
jgi:DNA polymerase-3 subunit alpha